jgi:ribosomal protein L39E
LAINQNLAMVDQAHHQEMERKKVLATKENLALAINQNQPVSQIILNTLEKKHLKIHLIVEIVKVQALVGKKSLKTEVIDLKVSPSKNIVKKELKSKIF